MKYLILDNTETLRESILADIFTFTCLAFCIMLSSGSIFWSIVCFIMFAIMVSSKLIISIVHRRPILNRSFDNLYDLKDYVKNLPE